MSVPACTTGHMTRGSLSRGISIQGSLSGDLCPGMFSDQGGSLSGGVSVQGVSVWGEGLL